MQKSWDGYITALSKQFTPLSNTLPFPNSGGPSSGFIELPKTDTLKKYNAMNPEWHVEINLPTDIYKPDFMPIKNEFN
jgi:hypothetical protein